MTANEIKAIKWMKNVRDDAVVTLDHIQKNEPNVSPMLYRKRKQKAETIIAGFEELESYRAIGTVEEFKALKEKNEPKKVVRQGYAFLCPACYKSTLDGIGLKSDCCPKCGKKLD